VIATVPNVGAAATAASPQPASQVPFGLPLEITLEEAVVLGLKQNRTIKGAYVERTVARFDLFYARSAFFPRGTISASAFDDRDVSGSLRSTTVSPAITWLLPTGAEIQFAWARTTASVGGNSTAETQRGIAIRQPLLRGGGVAVTIAPLRIATMQDRINQLSLEATVSREIYSIIQAYRGLAQAQAQVNLAERALFRSRELVETNRVLIAAGRVAAADIYQAEADVANRELVAIAAAQQKRSAQFALSRLLALDVRTDILAVDELLPTKIDVDVERAVELARYHRPDIAAQEASLAQAREALRIAQNNRLWDLSLFASAREAEGSAGLSSSLDIPERRIGITVQIPLGDYGAKRDDLRARADLRIAELRMAELRDSVESEVRDACQIVQSSWLALEAARRARELAGQAVVAEREKLAAGRSSTFQVLSLEDSARDADTVELLATIAYLNALSDLDQQLGTTLETWHIRLDT